MIAEKFASNNISYPQQESISDPYANWCKQFLKENGSLQSKLVSGRTTKSSQPLHWEVRLSTNEFQSWLRDKNSYSLFFDGASKCNPGVAGAGGILVDPGGQVEHRFAWGLGPRTNNEAEWMALLQGLHLIRDKKLQKVMVFGDSRHVIYKMINGYPSGNIKCRRLYKKAKLLLSQSIEIYHILRQNNKEADIMANVGASLPQGHFSQDGDLPFFKVIP